MSASANSPSTITTSSPLMFSSSITSCLALSGSDALISRRITSPSCRCTIARRSTFCRSSLFSWNSISLLRRTRKRPASLTLKPGSSVPANSDMTVSMVTKRTSGFLVARPPRGGSLMKRSSPFGTATKANIERGSPSSSRSHSSTTTSSWLWICGNGCAASTATETRAEKIWRMK